MDWNARLLWSLCLNFTNWRLRKNFKYWDSNASLKKEWDPRPKVSKHEVSQTRILFIDARVALIKQNLSIIMTCIPFINVRVTFTNQMRACELHVDWSTSKEVQRGEPFHVQNNGESHFLFTWDMGFLRRNTTHWGWGSDSAVWGSSLKEDWKNLELLGSVEKLWKA